MANERQKRLMREAQRDELHHALDQTLSSDAMETMKSRLAEDSNERALFDRLQHVDRVLRAAPMERAPQSLALKIIARLAEGLQPENLRGSGLALAVGLTLVALLLLPLLGVLGWVLLNALGNASMLSGVFETLTTVLSSLMNTLNGLVDNARSLLQAYPEAPALLLLIPIGLAMLRWSRRGNDGIDPMDIPPPATTSAESSQDAEPLQARRRRIEDTRQ